MPSDDERLAQAGADLADAVEAALGPWVVDAVTSRVDDPQLIAPATEAADACRADVMPRLRELLAADLDDQHTTPLAILRSAVGYPAAVLDAAGAPPARRDRLDVERDPDDRYGLSPAAFADFGPEVAEAGLVWGASKAYVHLARRSADSP